jgi:glycerol-3-phosphate dehydrogenase
MAPGRDAQVAVIGGGVVGAAVSWTLARRGVQVLLLEAEHELALGASGTNSGILHTGFDSKPGELETRLILRSAQLRDSVLEELGVPVIRCGALLTPRDEEQARTVAATAEGAARNGVPVSLHDDGSLGVPGESLTDPVLYTKALAAAAGAGGAELRTGAGVEHIARDGEGLLLRSADGETVRCDVAVNCAGLQGDEVARLAGDDSFAIYPRKGEFFVFDAELDRILLPVPTARTKGVLVFPTVDGKVVAGPTAHDQEDKRDWSVRPEAWSEVMAKVVAMLPALDGAEPIASYAGLRPAGRDGVNYLIGPSAACPGLVNVAAIRSTGMTASLGIGEYVASLVADLGVPLGSDTPPRRLPATDPHERPWWRRAAERSA